MEKTDIRVMRATDPDAFEDFITGMMQFTGYPRWIILVSLYAEGVL